MNIERIKEKLMELLEKHRVVFWNDASADFRDDLSGCLPQGVEIIRPDAIGQFKTKVMLEIEKPESKFLVYSTTPIPQPKNDWLLDIRLYGYQFYADTASMMVEELGLQHHLLREHIAKRKKFFGNKQRTALLKKMISPTDRDHDIDRKMLAVLVKADSDRFFDIVQALFASLNFEEGLDAIPEKFADIQKMDLEADFWAFAREAFGYQSEQPKLRNFLTCLFMSDLYASIGSAIPESVKQFILPGVFTRDAAVCLSEWRDSMKMTFSYDRLSELVAEAVGIESHIGSIPLDILRNTATFFSIEKVCASKLKAYIIEHADTLDEDFVTSFCRFRQDMHWANRRLGDEVIPRAALWSVYEALIAAAAFIAKKNSISHGFSYATSKVKGHPK